MLKKNSQHGLASIEMKCKNNSTLDTLSCRQLILTKENLKAWLVKIFIIKIYQKIKLKI